MQYTAEESRLLVQRMCGCWEMQGRAQARLLLSLDVHTELRYMVFDPVLQVTATSTTCIITLSVE
jgi:hypothetical protein